MRDGANSEGVGAVGERADGVGRAADAPVTGGGRRRVLVDQTLEMSGGLIGLKPKLGLAVLM